MATSSALLKTLLHKTIAEGLYKEVTSRTSKYFYFLGKTLSWSDETAPPYPIDSFQYEKDTRNEMITVKQIKPSDVAFVVDRVNWTSGEVYDIYDDQYSTEIQGLNITNGGGGYTSIPTLTISAPDLPDGVQATAEVTLYNGEIVDTTMTNRGSGYTNTPTVDIIGGGLGEGAVITGTITKAPSTAQKLENARFYVMTDEYNVYKCLDNNNNARSVNKPIGTQVLPISLADGYVWKYMYNVPIALRTKFLTDAYMPVVTALTQQFYSSGGIESVNIENIGTGYTSATIIVAGDGYLESDPVYLTAANITTAGVDYLDGDTLTVAQPISTTRDWDSEIALYLGQRIRYLNNIYEVERAGTSSVVGPTHRSGTATNGTGALKYLGTTAKVYPTFTGNTITAVNLLGGIRAVNLNSHGSGYTSNPPVTFTYPKMVFDGHSSGAVNLTSDKITIGSHWYETGDPVVYDANGGTPIGGLVDMTTYYVIKSSSTEIQLAANQTAATLGSQINLTALGTGTEHSVYSEATLATAHTELSPTGVVKRIIINDSGENYPETPIVTIGTVWPANTAVSLGEQYFYSGRLYTVTTEGTTHVSTGPSGIIIGIEEANGSAGLTYVGTSATGDAVLRFGAGYDTNPRIDVNSSSGIGFSASFTSSKSEAKIIPIVDINGQITQIQIDDPGVGYSTVDLTIAGDGIDATVSADISIGNINTLQANNELLTVDGTVNNIQIISQGYAYGVAPVIVHGDGSGAMAEATISGGKITQIKVTNQGVGYTYATVEILGNGFAAKARAIISPYGGHGKDAFEEFFARTLMFYSNVSRDKNQGFDVNNDYRQVGIVKNPRGFGQTTRYSSNLGSACYAVGGAINLNIFEKDMLMTAPRIINDDTVQVRYRIVSLNETGALLQDLDNSPPQISDLLTNETSQYFSITAVSPPSLDKYSGDLLFIDNKAGFTPSADETVTLRTVIKF
jgi:hypothetical protein